LPRTNGRVKANEQVILKVPTSVIKKEKHEKQPNEKGCPANPNAIFLPTD